MWSKFVVPQRAITYVSCQLFTPTFRPQNCVGRSFSPKITSHYPPQTWGHRLDPLQSQSSAMATVATASDQLIIQRVHCLSDNYSWIIHDRSTQTTAVVDPAEVSPVVEELRKHDWKLTHILNTHHHADHTGGNKALKALYNATIVGAFIDKERIPGIDIELKDGDTYQLGSVECTVFETPGHTSGHISFYLPGSKALFPGDTLFSLGCGRLFEGTPAQMWNSLSKYLNLPEDTRVYCAHEYTQSNARFAIAIDPDNKELQEFKARIDDARSKNEPTIPSLLGDELKCNPFLRPDSIAIREHLDISPTASNEEALGVIRGAKDRFRDGSSLSTMKSLLIMGWGIGKQKFADLFI